MELYPTENRLRSENIYFDPRLMTQTASISLRILERNINHSYQWSDLNNCFRPLNATDAGSEKESTIHHLKNWIDNKTEVPSKELASAIRGLSYLNHETPYEDPEAIQNLLNEINEHTDRKI